MTTMTFSDFKAFTSVPDINMGTYVIVARGVLDYVKNQYGIYPEVETIQIKQFLGNNTLSFTPEVYPIQNVYRIWYDAELIEDFSFYGRDILLATPLPNYRIPLILELDVGFPTIPDDLVLAIFRHIEAVFYAIDKHTDNSLKVISTTGSTTYFVNDVVPLASKETYGYYAGRTLAKV